MAKAKKTGLFSTICILVSVKKQITVAKIGKKITKLEKELAKLTTVK